MARSESWHLSSSEVEQDGTRWNKMEQVQAEVEAELRSKAKSVNIIGFPTCWVKDGQNI